MSEQGEITTGSDDWFMIALTPLQLRLYRYIASLTPHRPDAEDLFQKSLLTAWQQRNQFDRTGNLYAWLCGIARNHVLHHYRSVERSPVVLDQQVVEQLAVKLQQEDSHFQRRQSALTHCLQRLKPQQRELVEQYYSSQRTVKDLARSQGTGAEGLYKALQRTRAALEACITKTLAAEAVS